MLVKRAAYVLFCGFAGGAISAGYVAFITLLGVFDMLAEKLKAIKYSYLIETLIIFGVTIGNFVYLFQLRFPFGIYGFIFYQLIGGIFTGCLAGALAETLKVFPIISRRLSIQNNIRHIIVAAAFGKSAGALVSLLLFK